jgi:tetratricopeptide (TPR) repeat protein
MNISNALQSALEHQQSGNLDEAKLIYEKILVFQPENFYALHSLGSLFCQIGNYDLAIKYINKALQINPGDSHALYNLGIAFQRKGCLNDALLSYQKALELNPENADAYVSLGIIYQNNNDIDEAITCYLKALRLNPVLIPALYNLGYALQTKGELDEAIACYQKSLLLNPNILSVLFNLARIYKEKGLFDDSIAYFRKAIELAPDSSDLHYNLGLTLKAKGLLDDAIMCYRKTIQLNSAFPEAYNSLGIALMEKGFLDEARDCFNRALGLNPNFAEACHNLGIIFSSKLKLHEAITCYRRAIEIKSDFADAHMNLALALLRSGNYQEGWEEYAWRFRITEVISQFHNSLTPLWEGSSLKGKTILVYAEQGIGDEIMFSSCLPDLIEQNPLCFVECDVRLSPLFSRSFPEVKILEHIGDKNSSLSAFQVPDFKIAIGSLPKFFRNNLSTFPARTSYLIPDAERVVFWRKRFRLLGSEIKVGISWRGGKNQTEKLMRSIPLDLWDRVLSLQEVHFINLQYGDCTQEIGNIQEKLDITIHDWEDTDPLKNLDDFAAQIEALDLVISVDNATVHMAGALGVPVWTLLPFVPNWRWMLNREDSPWYPTMRLFRQPSDGDWESVIDRVKGELLKLLGNN